jgi:hypothetical protein
LIPTIIIQDGVHAHLSDGIGLRFGNNPGNLSYVPMFRWDKKRRARGWGYKK